MTDQDKLFDYLKRVTADLERTRQRVTELEAAEPEPVAVVGMSCRLPGGAVSPDALWDLLEAGADAMTPFPSDRGWTLGGGAGGFVADAAEFDNAFFGISPREALAMDPQQRLLLEAVWECVERAGIAPGSLRGTRTGVFAGAASSAYGSGAGELPEGVEGYLLTGSSTSVVSGRVAYALGLEGPAVTVDTACSSSLVALHLAIQALRSGECTTALAGGVCVMVTPSAFSEFTRLGGLAGDGRCKSYADAADGTGWSEGVGVLLLETLSEARRLGHQVLALVRGSAINSDGASNGLTAPNGPAQQRVIRAALADARLTPDQVDVVEGHGTGTTLGDPIEAQALLGTYGRERGSAGPLRLGSIKSNIGHTQSAAGVAGVIKMILSLRHETLPATLHVDRPSTHVDWAAGAVELLTERTPWRANGRPRRAGISSFGVSGTNAHVVVEEAPAAREAAPEPRSPDSGGPVAWVLSAATEAALADQARALGEAVERDADPRDVAWSLATTRTALDHRAFVVGHDTEELLAALAGVVPGRPALDGRDVTVLFSGQGAQRAGAGRALYATYPAFARALDEVTAALDVHLDRPSLAVLLDDDGELLDRTEWTQPALFALEVALYRLYASWGVRVTRLAGHSIGEVAAAHVAGVLTLEDAAALVVARGRLMAALPEAGSMLAVAADEESVRARLAGREQEVAVAAVNGPEAVVVSGATAAIEGLAAGWAAEGVRTRGLRVSHAFHSPLMEPMLEEFRRVALGLRYAPARLPIHSTVTGEVADVADPEYWVRQVRATVRFGDTVAGLIDDGASLLLELGPDAVLTAMARDAVDRLDADVELVAAMRRDRGGAAETGAAIEALGLLHRAGAHIDWSAVLPGARRVPLPTYAFQRRRFWLDAASAGAGDATALGQGPTHHPLLGAAVTLATGDDLLLTGRLSGTTHPWLRDHVVGDTIVVPGTALLEVAVCAADAVGLERVDDLTLETPLVLPSADAAARIQVLVSGPDATGRREIVVHARAESDLDDGDWVRCAGGLVAPGTGGPAPTEPAVWPPADARPVAVDDLYEQLATSGFAYGPAFRGVRALWRRGAEVFAEVALPEELAGDAARYAVHPALLDAALHAAAVTDLVAGGLPFAWAGVEVHAVGAATLRVRLTGDGRGGLQVLAADATGGVVATAESLAFRLPELASASSTTGAEGLHRLVWTAVDLPTGAAGDFPAADVVGAELVGTRVVEAGRVSLLCVASGGEPRSVVADALGAVQDWLGRTDDPDGPVLAVVTREAVAASDDDVDPAAAAVRGLVRSAQSEHPGRLVLVDLGPDDALDVAQLVEVASAAAAADEPEIALRQGRALVARLARGGGALAAPPAGPWTLGVSTSRTLDGLTLRPAPELERPLAAGQVRLSVRAAGVNLRDVLIALGMYPGDAVLGGEAAGVVTEVGAGVEHLVVGDAVMGLVGEPFGPVAVAGDARCLCRVPEGWSFEQAASATIVFLTALYGLRDLGGVRAGERVLVHAGAGGVGMAAIQVARLAGAEVFATASPGKWGVLRGLGLDDDHIASSRDLDFAGAFPAVDVVLNALTGEFVDASLGLLRAGGRFLEMGKTDLRDPAAVADAHGEVAYLPFDLAQAGPERTAQLLADLVELIGSGALTALPVRAFDVRRAPDAFRHISAARHVGKVVLTVPRPWDPDAAVLVTGATGTLGTILTRHLVLDRGVRHLVLLSRRGPSAEGVADLVRELEGHGADVAVHACDAGDVDSLRAVVTGLDRPVTAVVHVAGVVDDGVLASLGPERLDTVFRPKVDAALALDEVTRAHCPELAAFVTFSSAAAVLGSPGQANYAAANAFLDGLAHHRRAQGLPALSLAWGMWAPASGMTAGLSEADRARTTRGGIGALTPEMGNALFDTALVCDDPVLVPIAIRPSELAADGLPAVLRGLVRARARRAVDGAGGDPAALAALDPAVREETLRELVRGLTAAVLGHDGPADVDPTLAFQTLGLDSLTSVELRNQLGSAIGRRLPAPVVFDHPTPAALAGYLTDLLGGDRPAPDGPATPALRPDDADPVVVVGMSCRFPGGADDPDAFWRLLEAGADAVSGPPSGRGWPDLEGPGTRGGGFVHDADRFDAAFFGISPREALAMDPQQRLLLETSWEAFERAGIDPTTMRGRRVGVFAGASSSGYASGLTQVPEGVEGYLMTGTTTSVVSGRIAYVLGLEGPALTVDTACSSSLVALHLAARALRAGECEMALAGGVTVMATPDVIAEFDRQGGLSPDGRCRAFGAGADGTGWSEGAGLVLLERLSQARAHGHEVLAVVRGSAVNQDGASNGLTAPNGPSQQRVIRAALADAGVGPFDVDAVEAHGTGTVLGDPIEADALISVYGRDRDPAHPLLLGAVKSNIGHTQGASGIAGVIKTVLALRYARLPRTLHAEEPSPEVDWSGGGVELLQETTPWPAVDRARRAAVSAFGISGTNAHVVLEAAPVDDRDAESEPGLEPDRASARRTPVPWVLSARTPEALDDLAGRVYASFSDATPPPAAADVGAALLRTRAHHDHRAVVVGHDTGELLGGLARLVGGDAATGAEAGTGSCVRAVDTAGARVGVLFGGQGGQRPGAGRELAEASPVFAEALAVVCAAFEPYLDRPLREVVLADEGSPEAGLLDETTWTQPALFALEVALFRLAEHHGLRPDRLCGHSVGEIVAAHVAGVLPLAAAAELVAARGRLMQALPDRGAMVAVSASEEEVAADLDDEAEVVLAAVNGPSAVVLAGERDGVGRLARLWRERGRRVTALRVSRAFHSPLMDPMLDDFRAVVRRLPHHAPTVPIVSTRTGALLEPGSPAEWVEHWVEHARRPVRFLEGMRTLEAHGVRTFVELGPDALLGRGAPDCLTDDTGATFVSMLDARHREPVALVRALAVLWARGVPVDLTSLTDDGPGRRVALPTYPFQRRPFWLSRGRGPGDLAAAGVEQVHHPLLPAVTALPDGAGTVLTGRLGTTSHPWLADHVVGDAVVVPGTAFLEAVVLAGDRVGHDHVEELLVETPATLGPGENRQLRVAVGEPDEQGRCAVTVHSRSDRAGADWTRHATATLGPAPSAPAPTVEGAWPPRGAQPVDVEDLYPALAASGMAYGPAFRGLRTAWTRGDEVFAEVALPDAQRDEAGSFAVHPALLDAALHAIALRADDGARPAGLPFAFAGVTVHATGAAVVRVHVSGAGPGSGTGPGAVRVALSDPSGAPVAEIEALVLRPAAVAGSPEAASTAAAEADRSLFRVDWVRPPVPPAADRGRWALVGADELGAGAALAAHGVLPESHDDLAALRAAVETSGRAPDVVVLPVQDRGDPVDTVACVLASLQQWSSAPSLAGSVLVVATRGAVVVGTESAAVDQAGAAVQGLVRSARAENPGRVVLVDLDPDVDPALDPAALGAGVLVGAATADEPEWAVRAGRGLVPRLVGGGSGLVAPDGPWTLAVARPGTLDGLVLRAAPEVEEPLADGQVRLGIRAAGVNFRDVLIALGVYPGAAAVGGEAAGVVLEVGPGVTTLAVGDAVMGVVGEGFGPVAVADARCLVRMPRDWSFAQAASASIVFSTALFGLRDLGGLRAGERVLVHAGAGGVGMAAIQVARWLGAEVFATASRAKWEVLRHMGLDDEHIASSRDTAFAAAFPPVDVVLNALTGEFVDASLGLLRPGGRFLEMGKTDVRDEAEVLVARPDITYRPFDLAETGAEHTARLLAEIVDLAERGVLAPLPTREFDVRRAREAFRHLGAARHVGKVVLTVPGRWTDTGIVVLTGATGALGGILARHLVAHRGVRDLLLLSRRGPAADGVVELVAELERRGARVEVRACDVADRASVEDVIVGLDRPVTGVVHAAGVIDDGVVDALDDERVARVFRPKADAARVLDEVTSAHCPQLQVFVTFSSLAGTLGGPGQGNYAAANACLDALAHDRRRRGLPAQSLAWGLWAAEGTMTADRGHADRARSARGGFGALEPEQGTALFDAALARDDTVLVPMAFDAAAARSESVPALLRALVRPRARRAGGDLEPGGADALRRSLPAMTVEDRARTLTDLVRARAAGVLGHTALEDVDGDVPFLELGFDSLTAVELRNQLATATGHRLPATLVFDHPTPADLAAHLAVALLDPDLPTPAGVGEPPARAAGPVGPGGLNALFEKAVSEGRVNDFITVLDSVAGFRDTVAGPEDLERVPSPVRLSSGDGLEIVFMPAFVGKSGPYDYAGLAAGFRGRRAVSALFQPGFLEGDPLPADLDAVLAVHAASVLRHVEDRPFVLGGLSSGGTVAFAVARHLEGMGRGPEAVVLLDTYTRNEALHQHIGPQVLASLVEDQAATREQDGDIWGEAWLTGMGRYCLMDWLPTEGIAGRTLLVRASELPVAWAEDYDWRADWELPHDTVDVPGTHWTITRDHAASTAAAVDGWLRELPGSTSTQGERT